MNQTDLLVGIKDAVKRGDYNAAIKPLEKLLTLLKFDYENGIERERNGRAFNALAKVRKELINGVLSEESYRVLRLEPPKKKAFDFDFDEPEQKPEPKKEEPKPEPEQPTQSQQPQQQGGKGLFRRNPKPQSSDKPKEKSSISDVLGGLFDGQFNNNA